MQQRKQVAAGLALLFSSFVLASACAPGGKGGPTLVQPAAVPAAPSPAPATEVQVIAVGDKVENALIGHGSGRIYELTAPSDGVLVAQLTWTPEGRAVELWLDDRPFAAGSPIVGTLHVSAGRTYRLGVFDGSPWDYDELFVRYVLATSMQ